MQKKNPPCFWRAFLISMAIVSLILAILLIAEFLLIPRKVLDFEVLSNTRMVYLFFVTAYGGAKVAEQRVYDLPKDRRHLPLEFLTVAWGVFFIIMTAWLIVKPETVGLKLHGELSFVTAWVVGVFIAVRAGKDFPETWLR